MSNVPSQTIPITTSNLGFQAGFDVMEIYINNPTRGNVFVRIGGQDYPDVNNADFTIPPLSDRAFPVSSVNQFGFSVDYPSQNQPVRVSLFPTNAPLAIGGIAQANVLDPPMTIFSFHGTGTVAQSIAFPMIGRFARVQWLVRQASPPATDDLLTLKLVDSFPSPTGYAQAAIAGNTYNILVNASAAGSFTNYSDLSFFSGTQITATLTGTLSSEAAVIVTVDFIDRPSFIYPDASVIGLFSGTHTRTSLAANSRVDGLIVAEGCIVNDMVLYTTCTAGQPLFTVEIVDPVSGQPLATWYNSGPFGTTGASYTEQHLSVPSFGINSAQIISLPVALPPLGGILYSNGNDVNNNPFIFSFWRNLNLRAPRGFRVFYTAQINPQAALSYFVEYSRPI